MSMQIPETRDVLPDEQRPKSREIILINRTEKKPENLWNRIEQFSRILSVIAIPTILGIGGWWIQNALSERSVNKDYVALAVSILAKSDKEVDPGLRKWAVELLNANSPVQFDSKTSERLSNGEIKLPEVRVPDSGLPFSPISMLPENNPLRNLSKSIGLLKVAANDGQYFCGGYLVADDMLITADFCVGGSPSKITLELGATDNDKGTTYEVTVTPVETNVTLGYAILKVQGSPGSKYGHLTLAREPVKPNDQLFLAHSAGGKMVFSKQCSVKSILDENTFIHDCVTAGGVSGAPLIRLSDLTVVGMHEGTTPAGADLRTAKRVDSIRKASAILKS